MSMPLPPGWTCLSSQDGRPYYHNTHTQETTWTAPAPTAAAAAPPAVAAAAPPLAAPAPKPKKNAPAPYVEQTADHRYSLADLVARTGQRDHGQGFFELEREKLLEINLTQGNAWAWMKPGAMVARRGSVKFTRQGMAEQGIKKALMKKVTGEGVTLVKCEGRGKVFCADQGKSVSILQLSGESISVNGNDILALSGSVKYDIKMIKGAGMLAGGLFNVRCSGSGMIAFTCHGSVVTLKATSADPVYTDPNATVAWTHDPKLVTDVSMKALFGRSSGEEVQFCFSNGYVVIQPYEEISPFANTGGGGGGGGGAAASSALSGLLQAI